MPVVAAVSAVVVGRIRVLYFGLKGAYIIASYQRQKEWRDVKGKPSFPLMANV